MEGIHGPRCPECDEMLAPPDISIGEGVALCRQCGSLTRLSRLGMSHRSQAEIRARPPESCRIERVGTRTTATISLSDIGNFLGFSAVALFWNGITGLFLLFTLLELFTFLFGPVPSWVPAPQIPTQRSLGEICFMGVFMLPFVIVGIGLILYALMNLWGQLRVIIESDRAEFRIEVGRLCWRQRFNPREVRAVKIIPTKWVTENSDNRQIEIQADRTLKLGGMLSTEQREWLHAELKHQLLTG